MSFTRVHCHVVRIAQCVCHCRVMSNGAQRKSHAVILRVGYRVSGYVRYVVLIDKDVSANY